MIKQVVFVIFVVMIIFPILAISVTINVPADQPTIQAGIDTATNSDTVMVADGTYLGTGNRDIDFLGKAISVISENGPDNTIIDCEGLSTDWHIGFTFQNNEGPNTLLKGFTIKNGCHGAGGAIRCAGASPNIEDCIFSLNSAENGGAIYFNGNNELYPSPRLVNCTFKHNSATLRGGSIYIQYNNIVLAVVNCIFYKNNGAFGGAIKVGEDATVNISDCTFSNNTSTSSGVISSREYNGIMTVKNSIISFSEIGSAIDCTENVSVTYSDIYGNFGGDWVGCITGQEDLNGNISLDPLFVDTSNFNYNLSSASPCINAGDPNPIYNDPDGTRGDIGALFYYNNMPIASNVSYESMPNDSVVYNLTPVISWSYFDTAQTTQTAYEIEVGSDNNWSIAEMWATGDVASGDTSVIYMGLPLQDKTTYYLRVRLNNGFAWGNWVYSHFYVCVINTIRIPDDYSTIQGGIDHSDFRDSVIVAPGTYTENIIISQRTVALVSEGGRDVTSIWPENPSQHIIQIVNCPDTHCVIDGFNIQHTTDAFGIYIDSSYPIIQNCEIANCINANHNNGDGAGIHGIFSSAIIRNNIIHDNTGRTTAAGVSGGSVNFEVAYNTIFNNAAYNGAGIGLIGQSSGNIHHNLVYNNRGQTWIGGIYLNGTNSIIRNNTVISNSSGISILDGGNVKIFNNICALNDRNGIDPADAYYDFNDVWNNGLSNDHGPNGISMDPLFCNIDNGDLTIWYRSGCAQQNNLSGELIGALNIGCRCGDANFDNSVNLIDVLYVISYLYGNPPGPIPTPPSAGDVNGDGGLNLIDILHLISFLYDDPPGPEPGCPM